MNRTPLSFFFLFVLLCSTKVLAVEQKSFPYERYQATTISVLKEEVVKSKGDAVPSNGKFIAFEPAIPVRLRLIYAGGVRDLGDENRTFLKSIAKILPHIPSAQWLAYTHEIHVKDGESEMWLPIQGAILGTLLPTLNIGDEFDVYALWLGESEGKEVCSINAARTFKQDNKPSL